MKSTLLTLLTFLSIQAKSQTITGISPNHGTAGTTLSAIVTGNSTFFMTASSQHILNMSISLPNHCITIAGIHIITFAQDSASVDFVIPPGCLNGVYDLNVQTSTYNINMPSAITITGGTDYNLQSITPSSATENSVYSATITGTNIQSLLGVSGFSMYVLVTPSFGYQAGNFHVINSNTITADFAFPAYCDTGYFTLYIYTNGGGCFSLPNAVHLQGLNPKKLISINPDQGTAGNTLSAIVTGQNLFFMNASPQGFQYIQLRDQNCHVINGTNIVITDDDHFNVNFNLPAFAANGVYDLYVATASHTYTLLSSFTITGGIDLNIQGFSPSSATAGTTVHATVTGSNVDTILSSGSVSIVLESSSGYQLHPVNIISSSSQATMDFIIPTFADNGFYTLKITSAKGCFTLDQAIQISGGSLSGLISIVPDSGYRDQTISAIITSSNLFFMNASPQGEIQRIEFNSVNQASHFYVFPPNIVVIDSNHISLNFTIPHNVTIGFYNVVVVTYAGQRYSLNPGFEVIGARISGYVYYDVDSNGIFNSGDFYMSGRRVRLIQNSAISITNSSGQFSFNVDRGQFSVEPYPDSGWILTSSPSQYYFTIDSLDTLGLMFGLHPIHDSYSLNISGTGGIPKCDQNIYYDLSYTNLSTSIVSGVVAFVPDSNIVVNNTNPVADFTNGDTLFWNYDSLAMSATNTIHMNVTIPATAGTHINSYASVSANDGSGNILAFDSDSLVQTVVCSYESGDKSVMPEGDQAAHYTLNNNYLEYLIRFQNTGTDTANQVIVFDTLDNQLDPSSLWVIASSHLVQTTLFGNVVEFRFNNIQLPDSNVNEPGSLGYVKFKILPRNSIANGIVIHNKARIYFDLNNPPIITNTVFNTLVDQIPDAIEEISFNSGNLVIYPNPSDTKVRLLFKNPSSQKISARIFNINGQLMDNIVAKGEIIDVDLHQWETGMYFILVESVDGSIRLSGKLLVNR